MPKKILIIDDDPLVGGTVLILLKRRGFKVDAVLSGQEAVDKAQEEDYDLIISDIRMPGMSGIQAIETIQQKFRQSGRKCGFMFITGYAEDDAPEHALRLGVTDFLLKPFDAGQFIQAVENNLNEENPGCFETLQDGALSGAGIIPGFYYEKHFSTGIHGLGGDPFAHFFTCEAEARDACLSQDSRYGTDVLNRGLVKMVTHSAYQRYVQAPFEGARICIRVTAREIKKTSFVFVFHCSDKRTGAFLAEGWQRVAFTDVKTGRLVALPDCVSERVHALREDIQPPTESVRTPA